jgi:hypothetical protein
MHNGIPFSVAIEPRDRKLIQRAQGLDCYLWMNSGNSPRPDLGLLDVLGSCFEVAADAAALLRVYAVYSDVDLLKECLDVAAEAQSALRSAVQIVDGPVDEDQQMLYGWLRETAAEKRIFVGRHFRADDLADPFCWPEIQARIQAVRKTCQGVIEQRQSRMQSMNRLRYHANLVDMGRSSDHDWDQIIAEIDALSSDNVPPSNREIRDAILPILDVVPAWDTLPRTFQLVLREAETYRDTLDVSTARQEVWVPTEEVQTVRNLINGSSIVIIGGDPREEARQALQEAFGATVLWPKSTPTQSIDRFKPCIMRNDVKLVILLIRWARHSWGELKPFCDQHGKLFVRLNGGYSPNQVANQIVSQHGYFSAQATSQTGGRQS